jgi:hypothetical protein
MMLEGKMFYFRGATTIKQLLEVLIIWLIKMLKNVVCSMADSFHSCSKLKRDGKGTQERGGKEIKVQQG